MTRARGPEWRRPETGPTSNLAPPSSALAVCAHPDDAEFFVAGTFARWSAAGTACSYLVLTDGSKGSWDTAGGQELTALRQREQREAARLAGVHDVVFAGFEDGFLSEAAGVREAIVRCIRDRRPAVVCGHDPWTRYRLHPDHRAAGWATCDAVVAAREPLVWPAAGEAHRPDVLLLFDTDTPDHFEDVTSTLGVKMAALLAHTSQLRSTMGATGPGDAVGIDAFKQRIVEWCAELGAPAGFDAGESFHRVDP
jgi:LmbE family N-acetylglucosaminyl deacetylase